MKPFKAPVTFPVAMKQIAGKVDRPTLLKTHQIAANWSKDIKERSFFSARVASADILAELHRRVQQVASGEMTDAQAREWLRVFLSGKGSGALAQLGFMPPAHDTPVSELGSVRRLQLIIGQNVKMAQEVGAYRRWMEHVATHPYGRWRIGVSAVHRDAHLARDGKVFRYDHPIWTQDPPGGLFNCHCYREELTAAEVDALGLDPEGADYQFKPSPLQFDPSQGMAQPIPEKPGMPPEIKADLQQALAKFRQVHPRALTVSSPKPAVAGPPPAAAAPLPPAPPPAPILPPAPAATAAGRFVGHSVAATPQALKAITDVEDKIRLQKGHETAVIFDRNGKELARQNLGPAGGPINSQTSSHLPGAILTHNHPRGWGFPATDPRFKGNSFSPDDVRTAAGTALAELRAITTTHRYIMQPGTGGWPANIRTTINKVEAQVGQRFWRLVNSKKITPEKASALHWHTIWSIVSKQLGLQYWREKV
jgi:hypothetical protein